MKSISPGAVKTEIGVASGVDPDVLEEAYRTNPWLESTDISQAVLYVLGTRPQVQVNFLIVLIATLNLMCQCVPISGARVNC